MGVTYRAITIGLLLIPLNAMWLVLSEIVWYSGEPTTISLFYNVVFLITLLTLANLVLKRVRPAWALDGREILVVYVMLCIASALASHDMLQILVPTVSHLHRFEPIERRFGEFMPYVPHWLVVSDATALQSAYVGQESIFDAPNLIPWLKPLAWWFGFVIALCALLGGSMLLFRKQWTSHEKLSFPIIEVPMMLAMAPGKLLRSRLFWIGFGIAGIIDLVNGLNALFPLMPQIPIVQILNVQTLFSERPWVDMGPAWVSFYPFAIGMCFFMPLDLAFSCWFFFFFWAAQRVIASHIGIHGMVGFPFVDEQTAGGYYAVALIALWVSRRQLAIIAGSLLGRHVEGQTPWDRKEAWIAAGLIASGLAFLFWFCLYAGMTFWVVALFFALYLLISIAVTRMRAELGPPCHDLHAIGPEKQIVRFFGATSMRRANPFDLTMFAFLGTFNRAYRGHPMPHGMEGMRIAERLRMGQGRLLAAMGLAVLLGTACAFFAMLWAFNKYGASAQILGPGEIFGREPWEATHVLFTAPPPHQNANLIAVITGLLTALGLATLRMNLAWWPFHPVGYAISGSWAMQQLWLCIFVAWAVKALLLKYGGVKAYRPAVPFFVGLIMGDFMVGSFWNIYGIVMETSVYHFWPY